ncbi:LysR family transcriptional regulator [Ferrimonas balearica]|uniref:LysR family transcriptional regulator n=1 Tax=Ferrimonas balearica TaxID=44012 RepID=UPI001C990D6F|nr:LysR family transcriptional regulator [Ferrimonas balearica]MBY5991219.1 LysR family transcriptional regulator [Ferrimonas balearica]
MSDILNPGGAPPLDLELLRTFLAVIQAGELKQAAQTVNRSQAAVSMQLKRLEAQLGVRLMVRSNQGIRLTEAGSTLQGYAEQLFRLNAATWSAITQPVQGGTLRCGIPTDYAQAFVRDVIPELQADWPQLECRLVCAPSRRLKEQLALGQLDIAIVSDEAGVAGALWQERLLWVGPKSGALAARRPLPVAVLEADCLVADWAREDLDALDLPWQAVIRSPVLENLAAMVSAGQALALLPESLVCRRRMAPLGPPFPQKRALAMRLVHSPDLAPETALRLSRSLKAAALNLQLD